MDRTFAEQQRDLTSGRSGGRILWQPRIHCWYDDKIFDGTPLPEPFGGMTVPDIHRALGVSMRLYEFNACFRRVEDSRVAFTRRALDEATEEIVIDTPVGRQVTVSRRTPSSRFAKIVKYEVESPAELEVATWREAHATWNWDQECFASLRAELGDLGPPVMFMPRMNVQSLYLEKMGTEKGIFALYDWTDRVEAYFEALETCHDRLLDVINRCPIEYICFGENVHALTLPPDLFTRYHLPTCRRRCEKLHEADKFVFAHWDGDVKPLLPMVRDTGLDGIEAITPEPQGDVTLEEVKRHLGDDIFLIDGIPAVYFDTTFPVEVLEDCVRKVIDLFAPKLLLGISDEISSSGDIERIRTVKAIVDAYNGK